jgi:hypothetical protein
MTAVPAAVRQGCGLLDANTGMEEAERPVGITLLKAARQLGDDCYAFARVTTRPLP